MPGQPEYGLHNDGAGHQVAQFQAGDGDDRYGGIGQCVPRHPAQARHALGAGRHHVLAVQDVEHGGSRETREDAGEVGA